MAGSQNTFFPTPNMGMTPNQTGAVSYNPMSARDSMDKYFRAYWSKEAQREGEVEGRAIDRARIAEGRDWKSGENKKELDFRGQQNQLDRDSKARIQQEDYEAKVDALGGDFAWVGALTRMTADAAMYDQMYNQGKARKSLLEGTQNLLTRMGVLEGVSKVSLEDERDKWFASDTYKIWNAPWDLYGTKNLEDERDAWNAKQAIPDRAASMDAGAQRRHNMAPYNAVPVGPEAIEHRAEGGPVAEGKPYMVGEQGPEMFVPSDDGRIIPNEEPVVNPPTDREWRQYQPSFIEKVKEKLGNFRDSVTREEYSKSGRINRTNLTGMPAKDKAMIEEFITNQADPRKMGLMRGKVEYRDPSNADEAISNVAGERGRYNRETGDVMVHKDAEPIEVAAEDGEGNPTKITKKSDPFYSLWHELTHKATYEGGGGGRERNKGDAEVARRSAKEDYFGNFQKGISPRTNEMLANRVADRMKYWQEIPGIKITQEMFDKAYDQSMTEILDIKRNEDARRSGKK